MVPKNYEEENVNLRASLEALQSSHMRDLEQAIEQRDEAYRQVDEQAHSLGEAADAIGRAWDAFEEVAAQKMLGAARIHDIMSQLRAAGERARVASGKPNEGRGCDHVWVTMAHCQKCKEYR